jgi:hypothetical protein
MDRRVAQVVQVRVCPLDATRAELTVTAERGGERCARTMSAPPATILHAARALARHYHLVQAGDGAWSAPTEPTTPA